VFFIINLYNITLEISKGLSEAVNRNRSGNTMAKKYPQNINGQQNTTTDNKRTSL
jgi:hypothetical protein